MADRQDPPCPNLKDLFGDRYRIGHDPSAETWGEKADPWMMTLPCRGGAVIYPYGADVLALEIDDRTQLAKRVAAIPGVRIHQCGDSERTFLFPVDLFDRVAELVKPKRKRQWTEEERKTQARRFARTKRGISTLEPPKTPFVARQAICGQEQRETAF